MYRFKQHRYPAYWEKKSNKAIQLFRPKIFSLDKAIKTSKVKILPSFQQKKRTFVFSRISFILYHYRTSSFSFYLQILGTNLPASLCSKKALECFFCSSMQLKFRLFFLNSNKFWNVSVRSSLFLRRSVTPLFAILFS